MKKNMVFLIFFALIVGILFVQLGRKNDKFQDLSTQDLAYLEQQEEGDCCIESWMYDPEYFN